MFASRTIGRRTALIGMVAGALAAMAVATHAADTLAKIKESHAIVMGFYNEPPHNWVEFTGGGYKGMDYDMGAAALKKLGVNQIDQIAVDWSGLIPGLQAGRWDMLSRSIAMQARTPDLVQRRTGGKLEGPSGSPYLSSHPLPPLPDRAARRPG